jgi:hypothetical protein
VNALANETVGDFINTHFVAAHKKIGTFRKDGATKNGGNVATYFCLPDETVIHVIPGPVDADVFLREAHWAVDVYESAVMEHKDDLEKQRDYVKSAHAIRYLKGYRGGVPAPRPGKATSMAARLNGLMPKSMPQEVGSLGQAHWLLWSNPMPTIASVYRVVWTDILKERVTDLPVINR